MKPGFVCAAMSLIGSWLGARLVVALSAQTLQYCTTILLPAIAIFHDSEPKYWKRRKGRTNRQKPLSSQCFHRPGHWMLRWLFRTWNRHFYGNGLYLFAGLFFDTRQWQCQIGKPRFQYRGLIAYIYHGNVLFLLGIPAAICSILGNYIGTKMAIKIGGKFIRPVLLTAMGLLVIKLIWDTLS